jgi:acetyltransferase
MLVQFTELDYDREMAFIAVVRSDGVDGVDGAEDEVGVSRYVQEPDDEASVASGCAKHGCAPASGSDKE